MGLYLFIVALADIIFRDNYYQTASMWMSSWFCTFLGILAMTSLEVFRINCEFVNYSQISCSLSLDNCSERWTEYYQYQIF